MYSEHIATVEINGSDFHLIALDGVPTWCYTSGAIITNPDTLDMIRANVWNTNIHA